MGFRWDVARVKASAFLVVFALSLDSNVQAQQQGLVGQAQGGAASFDPLSQLNGVAPLASVIGADPTTDGAFKVCEFTSFQQIQQEDALNNAKAFAGTSMKDILTQGGAAIAATAISANAGAGSQAALQGGFSAILGLPGKCDGEIPPVTDKTKCEDFSSSTDGFDEAGMRKALAQVQFAASIARCKSIAAKKAAKSAECFEGEMNRLKENMDLLKKQFDAAQDQGEKYKSFLQEEEQLEQQNVEQLTQKLGSLDQLLNETQTLLNGLTGAGDKSKGDTLVGLKQQASEHNDKLKAFNLEKLNAQGQRTAQCFKEGSSSSSAIRNCPSSSGELLTPHDCVLSIFRDQKALELSGGTSRISPADAKKAEFAKKNLEKRLDQMLADFGGANPRIKTAQGFELVYGNELRSFGAAGQQMLNEIQNCSKDVEGDISRELQDPTSGFGSKAAALRETGETIASQMNGVRQQLDAKMRDTIAALFGQEPNDNFNSGDCAATQQQANPTNGGAASTNFLNVNLGKSFNCLDFMARTLQATIDGTPLPNSSTLNIPLDIPGADGRQQKIFCRGLRDCKNAVSSGKARAEARVKNIAGDGTFINPKCAPSGICEGRKRFFSNANQKMRSALQISSNAFARRATVLKGQQARVRALFSAAGVKSKEARTLAKAKPKALAALCPNSDAEICPVPDPFADELSALSGVPPIGPDEFSAMSDAAAETDSKASTRFGELQLLETTLATGIDKCLKDKATKKVEKKVASLRLNFNERLKKCKRAAGKLRAKDEEFANGFDALSSDLAKICTANEDNTACQELSRDISSAEGDCKEVFDEKRDKVSETLDNCRATLAQLRVALSTAQSNASKDPSLASLATQAANDVANQERKCAKMQNQLDGKEFQ